MNGRGIVVGLGNPGPRYEKTRHNAGFFAADFWVEKLGGEFRFEKKFQAEVAEAGNFWFVKPQTFMNLSGGAVERFLKFHKIPLENVLVLHDEIDLKFGEVKLKMGGGHAGHNGLRDLIARCGAEFGRVRIGVGRPENPAFSVSDFVLGNFAAEDFQRFGEEILPVVVARGEEFFGK